MIIVQANNIHESGAKSLLLSILNSICALSEGLSSVFFLDQRFDIEAIRYERDVADLKLIRVRPTIFRRLFSEIELWRILRSNRGATLLCFGNLPPLLPSVENTIVYFQTVLYFERFGKYVSGYGAKFKRWIERTWIGWRLKSVKRVYVQSNSVKESLCNEFKIPPAMVCVFPFFDLESIRIPAGNRIKSDAPRFFYPALGTPHKNHQILIEAWVLLAQENIFPTLVLTLDSRYLGALNHLALAVEGSGINVINLGLVAHSEVLRQLICSDAMIFPSLCESFGLPLIEAKNSGVPILAGEVDYVRDLVCPVQSFDPNSARSIARAVKRFLQLPEETVKIETPEAFLRDVFAR